MNLLQAETKTNADRVENLMVRMTLEQKVAQLHCMWFMGNSFEDTLGMFPNSVGALAGIISSNTVDANADFNDQVQRINTSKNELLIPALVHCEAVSGMAAVGATIFPAAIGLGATWNPDTVEKMSDIIRRQMLAVGIRQALAPVMDVARDPRWGRVNETYGEDPTLCAAMSVAFTKGLQGEDLHEGVIATAKHFLGYAFSEGGLNLASNPISPRELREVYAKPFQSAITEADLGAVMSSYGSIDGELIINSKHILTDLLRDEMGFKGLVVSDYDGIDHAVKLQVSADPSAGGINALSAGLDVELPKPFGFSQGLIEAVKTGALDEAIINRALQHMLTIKFKLGLFDHSLARKEMISDAYETPSATAHSLKAAREATVLLKNDGVLPLSKDTKKIAVIGPHADSLRLFFGGYTYPISIEFVLGGVFTELMGDTENDHSGDAPRPPLFEGSNVRQEASAVTQAFQNLYGQKTPSILTSIKSKCPHAEVIYEKGCEVAGIDRNGFAAAVAIAQSADVVILALGGKSGWGSYCTTGEGIDCMDIGLPGVQEELARLIFETGTPAVLVHMDAKPISSEYIAEHYPAILEYWFPGETGGEALADILFGDYNPAGRLPMTAARNAGQIPIYAMHRYGNSYGFSNNVWHNRYVDGSKLPLFYFGEGKSYTNFMYSNLLLDKKVKANGTIHLSCDIQNLGNRDGEEVVQVYVRDEIASMLRPIQELAGFKRIFVKSNETKTVHFYMRADQFAFLDVDMKWIVEAGEMTVRVGASSEDIRLTDSFEIMNTAYIEGKSRGFFAKSKVE